LKAVDIFGSGPMESLIGGSILGNNQIVNICSCVGTLCPKLFPKALWKLALIHHGPGSAKKHGNSSFHNTIVL
jgi:hypothetical protein